MFFLGKKLSPKGFAIKLSPLEFMILLRAYQADNVGISGYDLISELNRAAFGLWTAKSGTIYPILTRMKEKELISIAEMKSELGPTKKVYKVTELAMEIIESIVMENFKPELDFFGNYLEFVIQTLMKITMKVENPPVNLDEVQNALSLFTATLGNMQGRITEEMENKKKLEGEDYACKQCGNVVSNPVAKFCPNCGSPIPTAS
ncbi:MAG: helix-turn-helix transcriptional regulator [Promethearchaeota archaeon]